MTGCLPVQRLIHSPAVAEPQMPVQAFPRSGDALAGAQKDFCVLDRPPEPFNKNMVPTRSISLHADLNVGVLQRLDDVNGLEVWPPWLLFVTLARLTAAWRRSKLQRTARFLASSTTGKSALFLLLSGLLQSLPAVRPKLNEVSCHLDVFVSVDDQREWFLTILTRK